MLFLKRVGRLDALVFDVFLRQLFLQDVREFMLAIENRDVAVGIVSLRDQLPDDLDDSLRFLNLRYEGIVENVAAYAFVGFQRVTILAFSVF